MKSITKPTLLIQPAISHRNIQRMIQKAKDSNSELRPHFKTHQSLAIGKWFKNYNIHKIAVSSVEMAEFFAKDGWNDITIAFPLNPNEITQINRLAEENQIHLTLLNEESIHFLNHNLSNRVGVFIEIDTGYKRSGVSYNQESFIQKMIDQIQESKKMELKGFISHAGHTYKTSSKEEILKIHQEENTNLNKLKYSLGNLPPDFILSTGDTPSCSIAEDFRTIDEMRPGNFVFYDVQQAELGSCSLSDIAICLACPVIAKYKERNEMVVHGGAIHFSKEFLIKDNQQIFGYTVELTDSGWKITEENGILTKLSQEHGTLKVPEYFFDKYDVGDFIGILPIHSCLTANLMGQYMDPGGYWYDHFAGTIKG